MSVVTIPDDPKAAPPEPVLLPITLRTAEAAAVLGLKVRTVKSLTASGELPSFKVGSCRLFSRVALEAWAAARLAEAAAAEGGAA